jgi:hypothetical protein
MEQMEYKNTFSELCFLFVLFLFIFPFFMSLIYKPRDKLFKVYVYAIIIFTKYKIQVFLLQLHFGKDDCTWEYQDTIVLSVAQHAPQIK